MKPILLDIHTHQVPIDAEALAEIEGVSWDAAANALLVDRHKIGIRSLFQPGALIAWLDANRIAQAWISAPPPLYRRQLAEQDAARWVQYVNHGLAAITRRHAGRLTALPHLPIEHPDLAADIAARGIAGGARRFSAPSGGPVSMLSDPRYDALWRVLNGVGAFVLVHPGECDDARLRPFYLSNLLGNPYETTVAIAHLVFGGVTARFPDITFCFAHGGGAAAMLAGRFEQGFRTDRPGVDTALPSPRTALRNLTVDCITHDVDALRLAQTVFGTDGILFGSDWPFPMGLMRPHEQLASLSETERERILGANTARFSGDAQTDGA
ncbi:amidohydrolase family protein [Bradyrhizobium sp. KB893862 SZCCT0404]|uniref:amidohydrolase family protein n=1 Tax=Bradyrhizobium sp. KB893862 SZCCT0404 TaxID=2807672 RepID=UPI001BAD6AF1|nr:amidohydrolase family protein [Bradyrhizobium sp. KB893862 SZCCT0404]MBR1177211.1 amidohydrolase family protein [Bradyrhizobium sp. KB893862 SZCCT0404]